MECQNCQSIPIKLTLIYQMGKLPIYSPFRRKKGGNWRKQEDKGEDRGEEGRWQQKQQ